MTTLNRKLLNIIGFTWLSFGALGLGLELTLAPPAKTVLIDRSYCSPTQWQKVADQYTHLYRRYRQKALSLDRVVTFSILGQTTLPTPPPPETVSGFDTYGQPDMQQRQALLATYPDSLLLTC